MMSAKEYLPIGSVVLLKGGVKKLMVIGIMQAQSEKEGAEDQVSEFDYIGVLYPEGFVTMETMLLFNQDQVSDVVFRGYENPERGDFVARLQENMDRLARLRDDGTQVPKA